MAREELVARSRRDLLRYTKRVVSSTAPGWERDGEVRIVVRDPNLTAGDVQSAFDEISEKLHVEGVALTIDENDVLCATFSPNRAG